MQTGSEAKNRMEWRRLGLCGSGRRQGTGNTENVIQYLFESIVGNVFSR